MWLNNCLVELLVSTQPTFYQEEAEPPGVGEVVVDAIAPRALRDILEYDPSNLSGSRRRSPLYRRGGSLR
jgi:hypothetical protein